MIRNAIVSVFNKTNLNNLCEFLLKKNVNIYSSGGTYKSLMELNGQNTFRSLMELDGQKLGSIKEICTLTESPEMFGGRVKTLHPTIHGGILAKNNEEHQKELQKYGIPSFDLVIVNLYPFQQVLQNKLSTHDDIIENIDIGGHTLIRSGAKNYNKVLTIVDPNDYEFLQNNFDNITSDIRKTFAAKAFNYATQYDMAINGYFNPLLISRQYIKHSELKYGLNPQQKFAGVYRNMEQNQLPFSVLNGNPGYINYLDAINGYNLVNELRTVLNMTACASFKHTSPAGVGLNVPLSPLLEKVYNVNNTDLTPQANAYIRARNADPLCSFGDFVAINDRVDLGMAKELSKYVSDGIVAPDYDSDALEILKRKKKGGYVILQASNTTLQASSTISQSDLEVRELHGMTLIQEKNKKLTTFESFNNIVTQNTSLSTQTKIDLILANTTAKYTQSNTIVAALDGQVIAVGAGQQSRIDCMKLVKRKISNWFMRQHPRCIEFQNNLSNMPHYTYQEKINKIMDFIENNKDDEFLKQLSGVSVASDAFIPFNDNIDVANEFGCKYIVQPGGSIADSAIIDTCNKYNILMCMTGGEMRMFLH
ncbi:MAG: uncharacterized protein Homavirus27_3 [Homavirus sp.]|uniref:MGS-like domain-containing protein n=1 Tax=Homavirus sp. TaxID=2487769 RepID=A0A3G5A5K4_9VIRU|nr:MAG: uncharacterized protein Homavirus27_3 [Homavirus sp.]